MTILLNKQLRKKDKVQITTSYEKGCLTSRIALKTELTYKLKGGVWEWGASCRVKLTVIAKVCDSPHCKLTPQGPSEETLHFTPGVPQPIRTV